MIQSWGDLAAFGVLAQMLLAFGLVASGYLLLLRQAFASPDRARMLRLVWNPRGHEHELDPRGLRLIYTGAAIGTLVCSAAFVLAAMAILS